jgi:hypothetical protein
MRLQERIDSTLGRSAGFGYFFLTVDSLGFRFAPTPGSSTQKTRRAREAGDGGCDYKHALMPLSAAPRALVIFLTVGSWGSASLHPRLYAVTRSAG